MRSVFLIMALALGLVSATVAKADELEDALLQTRIQNFLSRKNVRRPEMYAELITSADISSRKKKRMAAMLVKESHGRHKIVSSDGAVGAWQVKPFWLRVLKMKGNLKDPKFNFKVACLVYDQHAKGLSERAALRGYSGGARKYADRIIDMIEDI